MLINLCIKILNDKKKKEMEGVSCNHKSIGTNVQNLQFNLSAGCPLFSSPGSFVLASNYVKICRQQVAAACSDKFGSICPIS